EGEYYLRFMAVDRPGVLARIAGVLGRNDISIASVIQKERRAETTVPIVIRTHHARQRNLARALAAIGRLDVVRGRPVDIRLEDRLPAVVAPGTELWLKCEGQNPTGSFKDRGMTVAVTKALAEGAEAIICASTGNTSASAAAYGARAGMRAYVVVPHGKIALG